jgi:putative transposase
MQKETSTYVALSHNVSNLVYHFVCPAKYRWSIFSVDVEEHLKNICQEIELRYDYIRFLEIGADKNHVHFLIQSTPNYSPSQIIKIVKSITARQIFEECPEVKKWLWGGQFWTDGYFVATVGKNINENVIKEYVKNQGQDCKDYKQNVYLKNICIVQDRLWVLAEKIRLSLIKENIKKVMYNYSLLELEVVNNPFF